MGTTEELFDLLSLVVARWMPQAAIKNILPVTPDASLRRYYRLELNGLSRETAIAMVFDSVASPEHSGGQNITSDTAYVLLSAFLSGHGTKVPELLFDARDCSVLLIEDCGDLLLIDTLLGSEDQRRLSHEVEHLYRRAIEELISIQNIALVPDFFAFQRAFTGEQYYREMLEVRDFILTPIGISAEQEAALERAFGCLAAELDAFPRVLAHRDFHSWNLMVDAKDQVRVIDFQDALLATRCYDIVGLLNDRDTDSALGEERYLRLLHFFYEQLGRPAWFEYEYDRVLLQRDLKVAGRFSKLSTLRGLRQYERWIPGTLKRIGRTLGRLGASSASDPSYAGLLETLSHFLPEVRTGSSEKFDLCFTSSKR